MNVTQAIQSAVNVKSKGKQTEINSEEFSKAFEKYAGSSNLEKKVQTGEEAESEDLKEQPSGSKGKSEAEPEQETFTLINPFLILDRQVNDKPALGQHFIIHKEPANSEVSLSALAQLNTEDMEADLTNLKSLTINGELTDNLSEEQIAALASLTESEQLIEGKTLSEVVKELNKLMESPSTSKKVELETETKSDSLIDLNTSEKEVSAGKESKKQTSDASIKASSSTDSRESTIKDLKQTLNDLQRADSDSEVTNHQSTNESGSENLSTEKLDAIKVTSEKTPHTAEGSTEKPPSETIKQAELSTLETENVDKAMSKGEAKETTSQADTDYDFVSLMRQLSSQSTKTQTQPAAKSMQEASTPVSKEQGMNLIQDMVTSLVENKEGQKTYQTTLHLTPETLGKVTVELSFNEEGLSGKLTFQSDEARRWMEGEWLDLKLPLESKGLNIKSFDFTTSQPTTQQQNGFSFSEQSNQSGQDSQNNSEGRNGSASLTETEEPITEASKNETNGLNVYV